METQRIRIAQTQAQRTSQDDALSGKGLDLRNRKTSVSGTPEQGENGGNGVSKVTSSWVM